MHPFPVMSGVQTEITTATQQGYRQSLIGLLETMCVYQQLPLLNAKETAANRAKVSLSSGTTLLIRVPSAASQPDPN